MLEAWGFESTAITPRQDPAAYMCTAAQVTSHMPSINVALPHPKARVTPALTINGKFVEFLRPRNCRFECSSRIAAEQFVSHVQREVCWGGRSAPPRVVSACVRCNSFGCVSAFAVLARISCISMTAPDDVSTCCFKTSWPCMASFVHYPVICSFHLLNQICLTSTLKAGFRPHASLCMCLGPNPSST